MITTEFKNKASEGLDEVQNAPESGNAFAAGQMKRETINALQNAMMNADADDSFIVTASMKLSGHFKSSASKREDKKDKGLSMGEVMLLQSVMAGLEQEIAKTKEDIDDLNEAFNRWEDGDFDPLNRAEDLALLQKHDEEMTAERWSVMSLQEQREWFAENIVKLDEKLSHQTNLYNQVRDNPEMLAHTGANYADPTMKQAQDFLAENGIEIDASNPTPEQGLQLGVALAIANAEVVTERAELNTESTVKVTAAVTLDSF